MKYTLYILLIFNFSMAELIRDNTNNIILDTSTNLIWQDDNNVDTNTYSWENAISYCEGLTIGSYDDWRLPNTNELNSIVNDTVSSPSINSEFQNTSSSRYWSSTTRASLIDYALNISFEFGVLGTIPKSNTNQYVRCVR